MSDRRKPQKNRRVTSRRSQSASAPSERRVAAERRRGIDRRQSLDRRTCFRFPIVGDFVKPVEFHTLPHHADIAQPGIITQLSGGGMAMVSFTRVETGASLIISVNIPGIAPERMEGTVVRVEEKGGTYLAGVRFTTISEQQRAALNKAADDYNDCELKLSFGIPDPCFRQCAYFALCEKKQKLQL